MAPSLPNKTVGSASIYRGVFNFYYLIATILLILHCYIIFNIIFMSLQLFI